MLNQIIQQKNIENSDNNKKVNDIEKKLYKCNEQKKAYYEKLKKIEKDNAFLNNENMSFLE